jgi:hypothetical protein
MCASVCPSQALFYGTSEDIDRLRPASRPIDTFRFGAQVVTTRVKMMVPRTFGPDLLSATAALEAGGTADTVDPLLANLYDDGAPS